MQYRRIYIWTGNTSNPQFKELQNSHNLKFHWFKKYIYISFTIENRRETENIVQHILLISNNEKLRIYLKCNVHHHWSSVCLDIFMDKSIYQA